MAWSILCNKDRKSQTIANQLLRKYIGLSHSGLSQVWLMEKKLFIQLAKIFIVRCAKYKVGLHALDTIRQRLQFDEMHKDTFFRSETQILD